MRDLIIGGKYKHYKGNVYRVLCVCKHSENLEELVVYQDVDKELIWARPKDMFLDTVNIENKSIYRFEFIKENC